MAPGRPRFVSLLVRSWLGGTDVQVQWPKSIKHTMGQQTRQKPGRRCTGRLNMLRVAVAIALMASAVNHASAAALVVLPDDDHTRGDWLGVYGREFFLLGGMRSPESISGGRLKDLPCAFSTGDPAETVRAWRST